MANREAEQSRTSMLAAVGLAVDAASEWNDAAPGATTTFASDRHAYSDFWLKSARLIARLPAAAHRSEPEHAAATVILETARRARTRFLDAHVEAIYDTLTDRLSRRPRVPHSAPKTDTRPKTSLPANGSRARRRRRNRRPRRRHKAP